MSNQTEKKRDALLPGARTGEHALDKRWHDLNNLHQRNCSDAKRCNQFARLAIEFLTTLERRDRQWAQHRQCMIEQVWTPTLDARAAIEIDPLSEQLHALATAIAVLPASDQSELAVKAMLIREFCEEKSDDVVHRLAASLADDLLNRKPVDPPAQ